MKTKFVLLLLLLTSILADAQKYEPVFATDAPVIDTFYNKYIITDRYRWLENTSSEDTKEWVDKETVMSRKYLSRTTTRTNSYNVIQEYDYNRHDYMKKVGDYYFSYAYNINSDIPALFFQKSLNSDPKIIVDPKFISGKDRIIIKDYSVSKDSKLLAFQFSRNGSDWTELKIVSLPGGIEKKDHLKNLKFSNIAWKGNGFYYSTYLRTGKWGKAIGQKVCYHKIGTEQSEDIVVFKRDHSNYIFEYETTSNEHFFILKEINNQRGSISVFYIDFESKQKSIMPMLTNLDISLNILDSHDGKLIATTTFGAENGTIVEIDPSNPTKWKTIVEGFRNAVLLDVIPFSDRIVAIYSSDQHPVITIFDYSGEALHSLELPLGTSVNGFSGESTDEKLLYYFTSYTIPPLVYSLNIKTFKEKHIGKTTITFGYENIIYEAVEFPSKDGVKVPMLLVHEKGVKLTGDNPVLLKAYGGFGIISGKTFDPGVVYFIKKGGIFAFAQIRGGGEKGSNWALEGRGFKKQNSIDDFIYAAHYLIDKKYTNSDHLAAIGASNGGLVVAASVIQEPGLFKVAIPKVAPLDMIRFEEFSVGPMLTDEYGTTRDSLSFINLLSYSPYQNIKEDVNYPAMLIVTSENDDRVPPFHSYKFVAKLQNRAAQKNPILLEVEEKAGHYGSYRKSSAIRSKANIYGFIVDQVGDK